MIYFKITQKFDEDAGKIKANRLYSFSETVWESMDHQQATVD